MLTVPGASAAPVVPPSASLSSGSASGAEERNDASFGKPEHPLGCLRHRPPFLPTRAGLARCQATLRGSGATAARLWRVLLPSSLAPQSVLQGPRKLGALLSFRLPRQPVGAASDREVSGLRRRQLLRLHHVRGRRLRESAEEI